MLRGKVEGEMVLLSGGSSVKGSPEDKQASAPCIRGSAKVSQRVTLALYTGTGTSTIGNNGSRSLCNVKSSVQYYTTTHFFRSPVPVPELASVIKA